MSQCSTTSSTSPEITTVTTATGALACSVRYDPWGSPLAALSPSNPCDADSTINDHFYRGQRVLTQGMNVSWSWAWNGVDRTASQLAKRAAIRDLFGV